METTETPRPVSGRLVRTFLVVCASVMAGAAAGYACAIRSKDHEVPPPALGSDQYRSKSADSHETSPRGDAPAVTGPV